MPLQDLIENLFEDKFSDAVVANPDIAESLNRFKGIKPKFIPILVKFLKGWEFADEELEQLEDTFKYFFDGAAEKGTLKNKDISSYMSWDPFNFIEEIKKAYYSKSEREVEKDAKSNSRLIYKDSEYVVLEPLNTEASCYYGHGTRWCISSKKGKNYFDEYSSQGARFIFVINKTTNQKHAIVAFSDKKEIEIFNQNDDKVIVNSYLSRLLKSNENVFKAVMAYLGSDVKSKFSFVNDLSVLKSHVDVLETHEERDGVTIDNLIKLIQSNLGEAMVLNSLISFMGPPSVKGPGRRYLARFFADEFGSEIEKLIRADDFYNTYPLLKLYKLLLKYYNIYLLNPEVAIKQFVTTLPGVGNREVLVYVDGFGSNTGRYEHMLELNRDYHDSKDLNVLKELNEKSLEFLSQLGSSEGFGGYPTKTIADSMYNAAKDTLKNPQSNIFQWYILPAFHTIYEHTKSEMGYEDLLHKILNNAVDV